VLVVPDDLTGVGPYSVYPRTSAIEANQIVNLTGGQYTNRNYRAQATVVYQNKSPMCQYRAVGHPILTLLTEGMVDDAARKIGMDPLEIRRKNLVPDDAYPTTAPSGVPFEILSHQASLEKLVEMMDYDALRKEQADLREQGIYRGIGLATFIEVTNPGPAFYGVGGAAISAQDGATIRLDAASSLASSRWSWTPSSLRVLRRFFNLAPAILPPSVTFYRIGEMTPYSGWLKF